jgi:enolase-phosphatase E1
MQIPITRFILLDIEGTTTDINFVHQVLFPYAAERLADYVHAHANNAEVQACLQQVKDTVHGEEDRLIDQTGAVETLLHWIHIDRKHGALKELQGLIWKIGFEQGDYQGHVYPDVPPALESWRREGIGLGIYSSGSVQAQRLLFSHSIYGDLTPYFSHYFDTQVGGKQEAASYTTIAQKLQLPPAQILFLSDVVKELDAAAQAGFQVTQLLREVDASLSGPYPCVRDFSALPVLVKSV